MKYNSSLLVWVLLGCALASCTTEESPERPRKETSSESTSSQSPNWLSDEAHSRGILFEQVSGHREQYLMPETMGGGAALFDMDQDGDLDAYLVQSGSLYADAESQPSNALFANRGNGQFENVTAGSGADDSGYGMGVACGDADGDGDVDIYVTNFGPNVLLSNVGNGQFVDATGSASVGDPSWSSSAAFVDIENDGDLDLYVCNYLDWTLTNELPCRNQMGTPDYCSPLNYESPAADTVYLNDQSSAFKNWSAEFGTTQHLATGLGVVCADFDSDGRIEIFVANDGMPNFLWAPTESGWAEVAQARGCALDGDGIAKAGMGVEVEDLDNDGDPDLLVGNLRLQSDSYYRNDDARFRDRTVASRLGAVSRQFTRFGLGFVDFDNDGLLDLYEANGRVMRVAQTFSEDDYAEPNVLMRGLPDSQFEPLSPSGGIYEQRAFNSRAAAFGDIDNDGGIDILIVNIDGPAQLLRNVVPQRGAWISFELRDANQSSLHARVSIGTAAGNQFRYARAAASYQSSNDPRVHFGLGSQTAAGNVTVTWSDGTQETFGELKANQIHMLNRGAGE